MNQALQAGETILRRSPDVLFRVGYDRVIVRKIGAGPAGLELLGTAAAAWIALDEPATIDELARRLHDIGPRPESLDDALDLLGAERLVMTET